MCTDETRQGQEQQQQMKSIDVQLVDNWHARWPDVIAAIDHAGQRPSLNIDHDGWLSARHNLLVAFSEESIAGHLSFRVQPVRAANGQPLTHLGRPMVEAQLESIGVQPGFSKEDVERMLRSAAENRARTLRCQELVGFN
jgi:hypothetical protein